MQLDKEQHKRDMIKWKILKEKWNRKEEDEESQNSNHDGVKAANINIIFDEKKQPGYGIDPDLATPEFITSNKYDQYQ